MLDTEELMEGNVVPTRQTWTDYDGDTTYGDFSLAGNPPAANNLRSYQPGLAEVDEWVADGNTNTTYLMTGHLGTSRAATYTAFGERIYGDNPRFGYAGAYGYQSHSIAEASNPDTAFPFLHVGARYYDPATGRFLQRDPIGVRGGLNSYSYVSNLPTRSIDPLGLWTFGIGFSGTIHLGPINFSFDLGFNVGYTSSCGGSIGVTLTTGGGVGLGAGAGVGVTLTGTNAATVGRLMGRSTELGLDTSNRLCWNYSGLAIFRFRKSGILGREYFIWPANTNWRNSCG